ncbi:MAG TPA: DUF4296 domain-containing protein [Chitinophagaceae bacterium]|nr:DUF4296 domain-containing protein [Chitinophagaceae bacterium]
MRRLFSIVLLCCIMGCRGNEKPEEVLPPNKMENVIWDVVQADEFVQNFVLKDSNKIDVQAERHRLYERVFKMHNTSWDQFVKSYQYYVAHPVQNKRIFDSLASRANRRIQDAYKGMSSQ